MAVRIKTSRSFNQLLKHTLGAFLVSRYEVRSENLALIESMSPPYLLLPNHVSFWDPFFIATFVPEPVYYVTSDHQFRMPIMRFLLGLVGAIPKSKAISDFETVRNIFRVKQKNGVIGVFPEGRRNWDGHTMPPLYATAKLIKALRIPVVVPILKGAFLALPRWSRRRRKGPVTVEFRAGFDTDEIKGMSVDDIHAKLAGLLEYDEWQNQRKTMHRYRSRLRAEGLELTLFTCPECTSLGTLRTHRATISCTSCGYAVTYSEYGFFEPNAREVRFETVRAWNVWQLEHLRKTLTGKDRTDPSEVLLEDSPAWVWTGFRRNPMKKFRVGALRLHPDRIVFDTLSGESLEFPLAGVSGVNVQINERMEFYYGSHLYSFRFRNRWVSGFKWMAAINVLKGDKVLSQDFAD